MVESDHIMGVGSGSQHSYTSAYKHYVDSKSKLLGTSSFLVFASSSCVYSDLVV